MSSAHPLNEKHEAGLDPSTSTEVLLDQTGSTGAYDYMMMTMSPPSTSPSANSSAPSSTPTASSSSTGDRAKTGRPNKWTASRQRKLARLYLYSLLPREDIPRALAEKEDSWTPGSVTAMLIAFNSSRSTGKSRQRRL